MIKVVVIKFKSGGKLYYFAPKEGEVYTRDMPVIVETAKGLEYAWVVYPEKTVEEDEITPPLKSVVRVATEKDKQFYKACLEKKPEAMGKPTNFAAAGKSACPGGGKLCIILL